MLNYFDNKDSPWVVMKYIENPLVCSRRKVWNVVFLYLFYSLI